MDTKQESWPPSSFNGQAIPEAYQQAAKELSALSGLWGFVDEGAVPPMHIVQAMALINIGNQLNRLADLAERAAGQP